MIDVATSTHQSIEDMSARRRRARRAVLAFLALSAFMYASIAYKIIHFGP